jgi:hypothetical protein
MNTYTDEDKILAVLSGEVPPAWWWFYHSDAKSQKAWDTVRHFFQEIYRRIKSYYSGKDYPFKEDDPLDEDYYYLNMLQYVDFYALIWKNWAEVKVDLDFFFRVTSWTGFQAETPGDCLINVIHEDCLCYYLEQRQETDFTGRSLYEFFRLKAQTGNLKIKENLNKSEENKLKKFIKYQERFRNFRVPHILLDNCLAACEVSKDRYVQELLGRYKKTCSELDRVIQARNHPSRKRQASS